MKNIRIITYGLTHVLASLYENEINGLCNEIRFPALKIARACADFEDCWKYYKEFPRMKRLRPRFNVSTGT